MLRERHWPGRKLTQLQLAEALGVSVPSISSWESTGAPTPPPNTRLSAYAAFFATRRSIESKPYRVLSDEELTDEERAERDELHEELFALRYGAPTEGGGMDNAPRIPLAGPGDAIGGGTWYFPGPKPGTRVVGPLPQARRGEMADAAPTAPDHRPTYPHARPRPALGAPRHLRAA